MGNMETTKHNFLNYNLSNTVCSGWGHISRWSTKSEVPNLQAAHWCRSGPVRNWATQQEVILNVMRLNHPETILPPQSIEKLSSIKPGVWCQKCWGPLN